MVFGMCSLKAIAWVTRVEVAQRVACGLALEQPRPKIPLGIPTFLPLEGVQSQNQNQMLQCITIEFRQGPFYVQCVTIENRQDPVYDMK